MVTLYGITALSVRPFNGRREENWIALTGEVQENVSHDVMTDAKKERSREEKAKTTLTSI